MKRLYIVTAAIVFEYAVLAESQTEAHEEALTKEALRDLGSLEPNTSVVLAREQGYRLPEDTEAENLVYGHGPINVTWVQAVEMDKAAAAKSP